MTFHVCVSRELGRDGVSGPRVIREVDGAQPGKEHEQPAGGPPVSRRAVLAERLTPPSPSPSRTLR